MKMKSADIWEVKTWADSRYLRNHNCGWHIWPGPAEVVSVFDVLRYEWDGEVVAFTSASLSIV